MLNIDPLLIYRAVGCSELEILTVDMLYIILELGGACRALSKNPKTKKKQKNPN